MTLRVLHVIPSFGSGGAERQLIRLAGALMRAGIEVHIAFLHEGPNFAAALESGARLHRLRPRGNHDPLVLLHLLRLIRRVRPSVVQTWMLHADVFGGIAARLSGVPWILAERCSASMYTHGLKYRLRRLIGKSASAIIANSESGLAYWRASGFRGAGHVIRNIIDAETALALADELSEQRASGESALILAVGRLTEQKNWATLLSTLEEVFSLHPGASAVLLGEGPLRKPLQEQVVRSPILKNRVQLVGYVGDVAPWYRRASVYVSLSHYEGTPNAVLEAMAHLCPVVISDIPEHREIVTSDSGVLVPRDAPKLVAAAICEVLGDPATATARARSARQQIAGWSASAIAEAYASTYQRFERDTSTCVF